MDFSLSLRMPKRGSRGLLLIRHSLVCDTARVEYINYSYLKHWEVVCFKHSNLCAFFAELKLSVTLFRRLLSAMPARIGVARRADVRLFS